MFLQHNVFITQELMTAAMGLNTSLIEDKTRSKTGGQKVSSNCENSIGSSPSFTVIQALVKLLASMSPQVIKKSSSVADNLKGKWTERHVKHIHMFLSHKPKVKFLSRDHNCVYGFVKNQPGYLFYIFHILCSLI